VFPLERKEFGGRGQERGIVIKSSDKLWPVSQRIIWEATKEDSLPKGPPKEIDLTK